LSPEKINRILPILSNKAKIRLVMRTQAELDTGWRFDAEGEARFHDRELLDALWSGRSTHVLSSEPEIPIGWGTAEPMELTPSAEGEVTGA
jgi:hypothetical protein